MRLVRLGEGLLLQAACGASPGEVAVEQLEAVQDPVVIKASIETCCPKTSLSASQMLLFEALYSLWTRGLALGGGQAFTGYGSEDDCSCKDLSSGFVMFKNEGMVLRFGPF